MKNRKLNYRIHNPNTVEATTDYILKVFIKANAGKVDAAVKAAASQEVSGHIGNRDALPDKHMSILLPQEMAGICYGK